MKRSRRRATAIGIGCNMGMLSLAVTSAVAALSVVSTAFLFHHHHPVKSTTQTIRRIFLNAVAVEMGTATAENPEVARLKSDLVELADRTGRGFTASGDDKRKAKEIVESLQRLQTIPDPARSYYDSSATSSVVSDDSASTSSSSIAGKWTLIYTDAPDITGLDTSRNPFSTAKLGRIGQECSPPYIKNVIEWVRPDWAKDLPFSGSDGSRVLQKVVTSGSATPSKPTFVELKVAGLELVSGGGNAMDSSGSNPLDAIRSQGLPAGILSMNPVDLKGPLNPPFGRFEILYLDEEFRAIRTSQNFLAVNRRITNENDEWF